MSFLKASYLWFLSVLVAGCVAPKSLPNNSACLPMRSVGLSYRQRLALRTFLTLGQPDSLTSPSLDVRRYCVRYLISERANIGLFQVSKVGDAAWPVRYFIQTPRRVFFLSAHKTPRLPTYTVAEAVASPECILSESTKADIVAYLKDPHEQ